MKLLIGILVNLIMLKLAFSEMMEMKCDEIKTISYYDKYYGTKCTISDISADSSSTFIVRSSNNFEYSESIQEVEFSKSKLYDIPTEIFGKFQFLKKVQANSCGLEDINKYNFIYASALQELRMRSNKIKTLPSSVFSSITTLITLDMSSNEISQIGANAFMNLKNLEYLTLTNNQIVSLDENVFDELTSLISIRMDTNKLQIIENTLFKNNLNLSEIRLETNEIVAISDGTFGKLKKLRMLNLSSNRLHKINILDTNLERLTISYNKLRTIDINKSLKHLNAPYNELVSLNFTGNTEMLELKLRQNFISDISFFTNLNKLEIFDLSFNPIGDLKISSFARMSGLVKLNLENANITANSLTFGILAHNTNLTHLDISYNQLKKIDFSIFTSIIQLSHLKIDGNNFTEIPFESLKANFPKLSLISLGDNDWNCSYLSNMIKKLRGMNVIVFVFLKLRVYDEMNVDGIRCHNNKTHVYWQKPIVHRDDNEVDDESSEVPLEPSNGLSIFTANLTKLWNKISEIQVFISKLDDDFQEQKLSVSDFATKQELKSNHPIDDNSSNIVESQVSSIRVILCLMFIVMLSFVVITIIKYLKTYASQHRFYYPSDSLHRSTATIQTTMEHVM